MNWAYCPLDQLVYCVSHYTIDTFSFLSFLKYLLTLFNHFAGKAFQKRRCRTRCPFEYQVKRTCTHITHDFGKQKSHVYTRERHELFHSKKEKKKKRSGNRKTKDKKSNMWRASKRRVLKSGTSRPLTFLPRVCWTSYARCTYNICHCPPLAVPFGIFFSSCQREGGDRNEKEKKKHLL